MRRKNIEEFLLNFKYSVLIILQRTKHHLHIVDARSKGLSVVIEDHGIILFHKRIV